jgi:aspartate aminotransferase
MIPQAMIDAGNAGSTIREIAEHGAQRAKVIGPENVFSFAIGNPSVPAPACVQETIERLLRTVDPAVLHAYAPAPGLESVRQKIADYLKSSFGVPYTAGDLYMTHGASSALAILPKALLLRGEEAVTLTPYFPEYKAYVEAAGGVLTEVPSDPETFQLDLPALGRAVTPNTKFVLLNSPNNPSGVVLSRESLVDLTGMLTARQKEYGHPIYIVADEPYRELVYGGLEVTFIPALYHNTIYCYSFSKALSLPGERVGYIALHPDLDDYKNVRAAVYGAARVLGYICASTLFQLVAAECLGKTADISVYEKNRDLLYSSLTELGYRCIHPDGAFYLFVKSPEPDARAFCRRALGYELLFVPGDDFGCPGYVRIAYCVPRERIERAMPAFRALAESYR